MVTEVLFSVNLAAGVDTQGEKSLKEGLSLCESLHVKETAYHPMSSVIGKI